MGPGHFQRSHLLPLAARVQGGCRLAGWRVCGVARAAEVGTADGCQSPYCRPHSTLASPAVPAGPRRDAQDFGLLEVYERELAAVLCFTKLVVCLCVGCGRQPQQQPVTDPHPPSCPVPRSQSKVLFKHLRHNAAQYASHVPVSVHVNVSAGRAGLLSGQAGRWHCAGGCGGGATAAQAGPRPCQAPAFEPRCLHPLHLGPAVPPRQDGAAAGGGKAVLGEGHDGPGQIPRRQPVTGACNVLQRTAAALYPA